MGAAAGKGALLPHRRPWRGQHARDRRVLHEQQKQIEDILRLIPADERAAFLEMLEHELRGREIGWAYFLYVLFMNGVIPEVAGMLQIAGTNILTQGLVTFSAVITP